MLVRPFVLVTNSESLHLILLTAMNHDRCRTRVLYDTDERLFFVFRQSENVFSSKFEICRHLTQAIGVQIGQRQNVSRTGDNCTSGTIEHLID